MKNKTYDVIKRFVQVILPAVSAAYLSLAQLFDLPNPEKVVGVIAIVTTFLGVSLGINAKTYYDSDEPYDGEIVTTETDSGKLIYSLELGVDPEEIRSMNSVNFKVAHGELSLEEDSQPLQGL